MNEIVGEALIALLHDDLKSLGVDSVGHRLSILKSVYDVKKAQEIPFDRDDFVPLTVELDKATEERDDINDLTKEIKKKDGKIRELQNDLERLTDEFRRLREDVLPALRLAKDANVPLPNLHRLNALANHPLAMSPKPTKSPMVPPSPRVVSSPKVRIGPAPPGRVPRAGVGTSRPDIRTVDARSAESRPLANRQMDPRKPEQRKADPRTNDTRSDSRSESSGQDARTPSRPDARFDQRTAPRIETPRLNSRHSYRPDPRAESQANNRTDYGLDTVSESDQPDSRPPSRTTPRLESRAEMSSHSRGNSRAEQRTEVRAEQRTEPRTDLLTPRLARRPSESRREPRYDSSSSRGDGQDSRGDEDDWHAESSDTGAPGLRRQYSNRRILIGAFNGKGNSPTQLSHDHRHATEQSQSQPQPQPANPEKAAERAVFSSAHLAAINGISTSQAGVSFPSPGSPSPTSPRALNAMPGSARLGPSRANRSESATSPGGGGTGPSLRSAFNDPNASAARNMSSSAQGPPISPEGSSDSNGTNGSGSTNGTNGIDSEHGSNVAYDTYGATDTDGNETDGHSPLTPALSIISTAVSDEATCTNGHGHSNGNCREGEPLPTEMLQSFRMTMEEDCRSLLPNALRQYSISAASEEYALCISYEEGERILELDERPLYIYKKIARRGFHPTLLLRRVRGGPPEFDTPRSAGEAPKLVSPQRESMMQLIPEGAGAE